MTKVEVYIELSAELLKDLEKAHPFKRILTRTKLEDVIKYIKAEEGITASTREIRGLNVSANNGKFENSEALIQYIRQVFITKGLTREGLGLKKKKEGYK